jgi:hypothetical protein
MEQAVSDVELMALMTGEKSVEDALGLETAEATPDLPTKEGESVLPGEEKEAALPEKKAEETDLSTNQEGKAEEIPVVYAKDGVHTLPYSVVEGLREQVKQLSEQLAEVKKTGDTTNLQAIPEYSTEDLELIKEEMPEIAAALQALTDERKTLNDKLADYARKEEEAKETEKLAAAKEAQAAIDSIPKLAHIQANDPAMFAEAVRIDQQLSGIAANKTLTLEQRFAKAVSIVEAMFGEVVVGVPEEPSATVVEKPLPAKAEPPIPNSLSDLPAGSPPVHDPLAALAGQSTVSIMNHFNGKTPAQIADMVNQLV